MTQARDLIEGWPALMSTEMAARYLSVDEERLLHLANQFDTPVVDLGDLSVRWRRQDLDKLIRKMPSAPISLHEDLPARKVTLDKAQIEAIADAVAIKVERTAGRPQPKLASIREVGAILGVGRSSVYRMMEDGRLECRHIGRRTLIQMASIEAILDGSSG